VSASCPPPRVRPLAFNRLSGTFQERKRNAGGTDMERFRHATGTALPFNHDVSTGTLVPDHMGGGGFRMKSSVHNPLPRSPRKRPMRPEGSVAGDRRATLVLRRQELPRWCTGWSPIHRGNRAVRPPGLHCRPGEFGAQKSVVSRVRHASSRRWGGD